MMNMYIKKEEWMSAFKGKGLVMVLPVFVGR